MSENDGYTGDDQLQEVNFNSDIDQDGSYKQEIFVDQSQNYEQQQSYESPNKDGQQEEKKETLNFDNEEQVNDANQQNPQNYRITTGAGFYDKDIDTKIKYWEEKCKKDKAAQKFLEIPEVFDPFGPFFNNRECFITVKNPTQKQSGISKYTAYLVVTQEQGSECSIYRRYNEFELLRKTLTELFPGTFIPQIPEKQQINVSDYQMTKYRNKVFNGFLRQIASIPHLINSEPVITFLKTQDPDCRKKLEPFLKQNTIEIIERYGKYFSHLQGKDVGDEQLKQLDETSKQIKDSHPKLAQAIHVLEKLADLKDKQDANFSALFEFCLNDYEKQNFSEYIGKDNRKLLVANPQLEEFTELKQNVLKQGSYNPYRQLLECMQSEYLYEDGMKDALDSRHQLEKKRNEVQKSLQKHQEELEKINSGKAGLRAMFSSNKAEDKKKSAENQIQANKVELENLEKLFNIVTAIFIYIDIPNFQKRKFQMYKKVMKLISSTQVNKCLEQVQFWDLLGNMSKEFSVIQEEEQKLRAEQMQQEAAEKHRIESERQNLQQQF